MIGQQLFHQNQLEGWTAACCLTYMCHFFYVHRCISVDIQVPGVFFLLFFCWQSTKSFRKVTAQQGAPTPSHLPQNSHSTLIQAELPSMEWEKKKKECCHVTHTPVWCACRAAAWVKPSNWPGAVETQCLWFHTEQLTSASLAVCCEEHTHTHTHTPGFGEDRIHTAVWLLFHFSFMSQTETLLNKKKDNILFILAGV